ncbi:hypothetical protein D3C72_2487570 [compost metagenome]
MVTLASGPEVSCLTTWFRTLFETSMSQRMPSTRGTLRTIRGFLRLTLNWTPVSEATVFHVSALAA